MFALRIDGLSHAFRERCRPCGCVPEGVVAKIQATNEANRRRNRHQPFATVNVLKDDAVHKTVGLLEPRDAKWRALMSVMMAESPRVNVIRPLVLGEAELRTNRGVTLRTLPHPPL